MPNPKMPAGLRAGGRALWRGVADEHDLDPAQVVQLTEACRMKDRCDTLNQVLCGDADTWMHLAIDVNSDGSTYELRITNALTKANETANGMKQLLAALRLPDPASGKRPQRRSARGAVAPQQPGGKVSSLERARAAKSS